MWHGGRQRRCWRVETCSEVRGRPVRGGSAGAFVEGMNCQIGRSIVRHSPFGVLGDVHGDGGDLELRLLLAIDPVFDVVDGIHADLQRAALGDDRRGCVGGGEKKGQIGVCWGARDVGSRSRGRVRRGAGNGAGCAPEPAAPAAAAACRARAAAVSAVLLMLGRLLLPAKVCRSERSRTRVFA